MGLNKFRKFFSKYSLIYGFLFATSLIIGNRIYNTHNLFTNTLNIILDILLIIVLGIIFSFITELLFHFIDRILLNTDTNTHIKKYDYMFWLIIFLSFVPAFLAYYPGICSYDALEQTKEALGLLPLSNHHPFLHTEIWHLCLIISNGIYKNATVIYSLTQMLIFSYSLSRLVTYISKKNLKFAIITLLYLCINPVIGIFSTIMTKDILFSSFFILLVVELCKAKDDINDYLSSTKNCIKISTIIFITCWFRNNCLFVLLIGFLIFIIVYRKYIKKLLLVFIVPLLLFLCTNNAVVKAFNIKKSPLQEMACIPVQQMGLAIRNHSYKLDKDSINQINNVINVQKTVEDYNYRFLDPIKGWLMRKDIREDMINFTDVYFKLLNLYPEDYVNAALELNIPYWYQLSTVKDPYSQRDFIETRSCFYQNNYVDSKSSILNSYYESIANFDIIEKIPVISWIYSLSLPIWLLLFLLVYSLHSKDTTSLLVFLPFIMLMISYLVGPVSNFRYILPIHLSYPLLLFLPFARKTSVR